MPNRRQAIILTNADSIHWCIYAALGGDELNAMRLGKVLLTVMTHHLRGLFQYKDHLLRYRNSHYKDKTVMRIIFIMRIPIPIRWHLYIMRSTLVLSFYPEVVLTLSIYIHTHEAITWTNVNLSSARSCGIHRRVSLKDLKISQLVKQGWKLHLKSHPDFPGDN